MLSRVRTSACLESIVRDLLFGARSLRSRPAFAPMPSASVATTASANAAIFTLVDALLLRPLPVSPDSSCRYPAFTRTAALTIASGPATSNTHPFGVEDG